MVVSNATTSRQTENANAAGNGRTNQISALPMKAEGFSLIQKNSSTSSSYRNDGSLHGLLALGLVEHYFVQIMP